MLLLLSLDARLCRDRVLHPWLWRLSRVLCLFCSSHSHCAHDVLLRICEAPPEESLAAAETVVEPEARLVCGTTVSMCTACVANVSDAAIARVANCASFVNILVICCHSFLCL